MTEGSEINQSTERTFKKYIPIITCITVLISVILFFGINLERNLDNLEIYRKWGSPPAIDIFNGSIWGLLSSNFLHTELWHIGLNLYWLWFFGKKIEFQNKKLYFVLLILSSGLFCSFSQLSFSDNTGIGLSGIVYSFFGYIFIKGLKTEEYQNYLDRKTIKLFFLSLFLCILLTHFEIWTIGNSAHIGGLIWGMTLAYISRFQLTQQLTISLLFLLFMTSMIFWTPFSTAYLSQKAYNLHKDQKIDDAILVYKIILNRDNNNQFAKDNLKQLKIHKLSEIAIQLHTNKKFKKAKQIYNQILILDEQNEWAKSNLKLLPNE